MKKSNSKTQTLSREQFLENLFFNVSSDTKHKLNVHVKFKRFPGCLMNILVSLCHVSREQMLVLQYILKWWSFSSLDLYKIFINPLPGDMMRVSN